MTLDERRGHLRYLPPKTIWVTHCDNHLPLGQVVNISESGLLLLGQNPLVASDTTSISLSETAFTAEFKKELKTGFKTEPEAELIRPSSDHSHYLQSKPLISSLPLELNIECLWVDQSGSSMAWSGVQFINLSPTQIIGIAQILALSALAPS